MKGNGEKNRIVYTRPNGDDLIAFGIVIILYYALFNGAVFAIFDRFQLQGKHIADALLFGIQSLAIAVAMITAFQRKPVLAVCLYAGVIFMYLATALFYAANKPILIGTCKNMFVFCIPILVLVSTLHDKSILVKQLSRCAYSQLICGLIYAILSDVEGYSMWLGYCMLLPCMLLILRLLKGDAGWKECILLPISVYIMLTKGSRGPLLILGAYIVFAFVYYKCCASAQPVIDKSAGSYKVLYYKKVYRTGMLILALFGIVAVVLVLVNIQPLSKWLYDFLFARGIEVRTLRVFSMDNGLLYSSGRDSIAKCALQAISERPLIGYGLGGDCVYIGREVYHVLPTDAGGMYAHNLMLELSMHHGVVVGIGVLSVFVIAIIRKLRVLQRNSSYKDLMIITLIYGFTEAMITSTYLKNNILWLLLGLVVLKDSNTTRCSKGAD